MTPSEFANRMSLIRGEQNNDATHDPEKQHLDADNLLLEALTSLGYKAGVLHFRRLTRWYA